MNFEGNNSSSEIHNACNVHLFSAVNKEADKTEILFIVENKTKVNLRPTLHYFWSIQSPAHHRVMFIVSHCQQRK